MRGGGVENELLKKVEKEWWRNGGGMVEEWWRNGGGMVEEWWRNGGGMVEEW